MSEKEIINQLEMLCKSIKDSKSRRGNENKIVFSTFTVESDIEAIQRNFRFIQQRKRKE